MCLSAKPPYAPTQIHETLDDMFRPFAPVERCSVESSNDGLYRCLVRLQEPDKHDLAARTLGGELHGDQMRFDIRLRPC